MRMTKHAIHIVGLGISIAALVIPGLALAGSSDIGLFAGGGAVPPNIHLLIDNSGSMDRDVFGVSPCVLPCESRRYIATNAIQTFVDQVNPIVMGVREENARLGLSTYRANGSSLCGSFVESDRNRICCAPFLPKRAMLPLRSVISTDPSSVASTRPWRAKIVSAMSGIQSSTPRSSSPFDDTSRASTCQPPN